MLLGWIGWRWWEYRQLELLRNGIGALKVGDYSQAFDLIEPYAARGNPLGQRMLGYIYAFGLSVPQDNIEAQIWLRRAERDGDAPGGNEYGVAMDMLQGFAGKKDATLAAWWLERAAQAGHRGAQSLLADPGALAARAMTVDAEVSEYWRRKIPASLDSPPSGVAP